MALKRSGWPAELVVVDDGSTDGTANQACAAASGRMPIRVVRQPNTGRFAARRAGIEAAEGTHVLLLDSRCKLAPDALAFVHRRLSETHVWNGHVHVVAEGNPFGAFWNVLVRLAWADYFAAPRTTTFDARTFDRFPKGTGCFLAPRPLLLEAVGAFRSRYEDLRLANDDTPLIRWIAEREPIGISPVSRAATRRGPRSARFCATLNTAAWCSSTANFTAARNLASSRPSSPSTPSAPSWRSSRCAVPEFGPLLASATSASAVVAAARAQRSRFEVASFGALAPVYAAAHSVGMWRGLALAAMRGAMAVLGRRREMKTPAFDLVVAFCKCLPNAFDSRRGSGCACDACTRAVDAEYRRQILDVPSHATRT